MGKRWTSTSWLATQQITLGARDATPNPDTQLNSDPVRGKIFIHVLAYQPGAENTKSALRELAARTLAEFDLTGHIE